MLNGWTLRLLANVVVPVFFTWQATANEFDVVTPIREQDATGVLILKGTENTQEQGMGEGETINGATCDFTYSNVKEYLLKESLTDKRLPGGCAWQAADILPINGFIKTHSHYGNANVGEVCVFGGGTKKCKFRPIGTIAVKTKDGWFDGCPGDHKFLKSRPLLGCFKKLKKSGA